MRVVTTSLVAHTSNRFLIYSGLVLLILLPLAAWLPVTGDPLLYFTAEVPPGQGVYVLSKLAGLYAITVLGLQMVIGLLANKRVRATHKQLGILLVITTLLHVGLFVIAASLRAGTITYSMLWPTFATGYYQQSLSLGVIALVLMGIVVMAGCYRFRHGSLVLVHRLSVFICGLAFVHSFWIGSETRNAAIITLYVLIALSVFMAGIYRYSKFLKLIKKSVIE